MSADSTGTVELLTTPEVAEMLKISVATMRRLQEQRRITFHKVGGSVRYAKKDIVLYLAKRRWESIDAI